MAADLQYTLGIDPGSTDRIIDSLRDKLIGLGTVAFGGAILARGFQFNQTMYDGERAIRAIVQQFQGLNAEAAKPIAAKAMQQLIELEPKVAGSLADIVGGFTSTAAAAAGVGLSVEENIDLVGRFANALGKLAMPIDQVGQELRSILTGNIGADSQLARTLGITNEMAESARKAGTLYQMLRDKVGQLGEAGDNAATTFSSLQSAIDKAAGALASGLFETAINNSSSLTGELDKNREAFQNLGEAIGWVAREAVKFVGFVNELTSATARLVAIAGTMIEQGVGYGEATKIIDEAVEARKRDETAALAEAEASKKAAQAAADEAAAKALIQKKVAAATAKAREDENGGASAKKKKSAGKKDEDGFDADKAAKAFDEVIDKQESLDELKRRSAMDEMTTAQKVAAIRDQIAEAAAREEALRADPFAPDEGKILDAEKQKLELQRELNALLKQQAKDEEEVAKKAQDHAETARKERAEKDRARNDAMGELAILREQAAGHDKKAEALQRQLKIEQEKQALMQKTGASEGDALRMATEKAALEDRIAKRKESAARRNREDSGPNSRDAVGTHIGGVTNSRMMGGGIDDWKKLQKGDNTFDVLQKQKFGAGALAPGKQDGDASSPAGGFDDTMKRMGRMMGQSNVMRLSDRAASATTPPAPKNDGPKNVQADPVLGKLDLVVSELKRIKTV